jgi:hypothetical protein
MTLMNDIARGPWIQFQSGAIWYPFSPRAEDLDVRDLEALSRIGRFNGHCAFYSVAEHSVRCAERAAALGYSLELQWQTLNHDAHEVACGDFAAPLKAVRRYSDPPGPVGALAISSSLRLLETMQSDAIRDALRMPRTLGPEVKRIDLELLATERRDLMVESQVEWGPLPAPLLERITPQTPDRAWAAFIDCWNRLRPEGVEEMR